MATQLDSEQKTTLRNKHLRAVRVNLN